jgi:thiamine monophosphate kinase
LPVSPAARRWIARQIVGGKDEAQARRQLASFGDDYQILFTAPPEHFDGIRFCHPETSLSVQWIGKVREGAGVSLTFKDEPVEAGAGGWVHGLGA